MSLLEDDALDTGEQLPVNVLPISVLHINVLPINVLPINVLPINVLPIIILPINISPQLINEIPLTLVSTLQISSPMGSQVSLRLPRVSGQVVPARYYLPYPSDKINQE